MYSVDYPYETEEELGPFYEDFSPENIQRSMSPEDGFQLTRNDCGYINIAYWAGLCGCTEEELLKKADGKLIWKDPEQAALGADRTRGWVTREEILLGNRFRKLKRAEELNKRYGQLDEVVRLLSDNLPDKPSGEEIHVSIAATWLQKMPGFLSGFIASLLKMNIPPEVLYDPYSGKWDIICHQDPNRVLNGTVYGTARMPCIEILLNKLNFRPLTVFDRTENRKTGNKEPVINRTETMAAMEKWEKAVAPAFQDYCHGSSKREKLIEEAYSEAYGYGLCRFDGSYLRLEDVKEISLFDYQKNAVAHILSAQNVLLADSVGSGKTLEYSCGIHELLRLGICRKAVVVLPNHTLKAAADAYRKLFPEDRIRLCRPNKEFSPDRRWRTLKEIREAESLIVFMAASSFDMLKMTREYALSRQEAKLSECRREVEEAKERASRLHREAMLRNMQKKAQKLREAYPDSETECFDELGFDLLVVDEAHNYKNISLDYSNSHIVGMHSRGSIKADSMLEKVRFIQERKGRVIFATGTPVTNSLADLYVFQLYLQPEELKASNIVHFNDWVNTFCEEQNSFEVDVDSKSCRFITRFSRFHNLPELMAMFSEVCHFHYCDGAEAGIPGFSGYTDVAVKRSETQREYIDRMADRVEAIRRQEVEPEEDNLLKVTSDGRKIALDPRLFPELRPPFHEETKVCVCAERIAKLYFSRPGTCQIAFSDIGTPKSGFNLYDELKLELMIRNVPEEQIAYVHDAVSESQRTELEKKFNAGELRVLIGSTAKLGTGSNVQERLLAIHHLDVPWRPADMVQREGRILRQGNTCGEVFIYRYITERSFDAYNYQILENKQRFIAQFLSGSLSAVHREEEDCADTVLSYAEIKALAIGDPLIKERVEVANRLERARIHRRQRRKEQQALEELLARLPAAISDRRRLMENAAADIEYYGKNRESVNREERRSFGEELLYALSANADREKERLFSEYRGFEVRLPRLMEAEKPYILLGRPGSNSYMVSMKDAVGLGVCQRLDRFLESLPKEYDRHQSALQDLMLQKTEAESELEAGNSYDREVAELLEKLKNIDERLTEGKDL